MEETLHSLATWGYIAIAFFSIGGSLLIVVAAGVFASLGKIDLMVALSVAALFNFLGDNLLFYLSRYQRTMIMPYFKSHRRKLAFATILYKKYGSLVMFIKKFIYGVKTLIPLSMGLSKYEFKRFVILNFFATLFFVSVVGLGGYYGSQAIVAYFDIIRQKPWIAPVMLFSILGLIWLFLSKATKK